MKNNTFNRRFLIIVLLIFFIDSILMDTYTVVDVNRNVVKTISIMDRDYEVGDTIVLPANGSAIPYRYLVVAK